MYIVIRFCSKYKFILVFAGICLIYLILMAALPKDSIWISDEGNRIMSVQAYALTGSSALPDPLHGIENVPEGIRPYPKPYFIQKCDVWRSAYQLFFSYTASFFYLIFGQIGALAIVPVMGLLTILFAGLIAKEIFKDEYKAIMTMLLCAFATPILFYSGTFLETTSASCFAMAALLLFLKSDNTSSYEFLKHIIVGLLAGIAVLFREEALIFAFGLGLGIVCCRFSWKKLTAVGMGGAIVVLTLFAYNLSDSGSIFGMHSVVYNSLGKPAGNAFIFKLTDYSFYLFLLCLPFYKQLNLVLPWLLVCGLFAGLIPKIGRWLTFLILGIIILCCGASIYCNLATEHGGVFIYQSLLDHLPLFAFCLICGDKLFREPDWRIRFLNWIAAAGCFIPPLLLNYHQPGMFWGGRHFLNIIPVLVILSIVLLWSKNIKYELRICGWLLIVLSLAANLSGYAVLKIKKDYSAGYVNELRKPEYQVIVTDVFWLPEELAWISRERNLLYLTGPDSLDKTVQLLKKTGIRKFHLILSKNARQITNESLERLIRISKFEPGKHFRLEMLSFFEIQIFDVTFFESKPPAELVVCTVP